MKALSILLIILALAFIIGVSSCQQAAEEQTKSNICPKIAPASPEAQQACEARGGQMTGKNDTFGCPTAPECVVPNEVIIKDFAFSPSELTVSKGSRVIWRNEDSVKHTVTFDQNQFYFINYPLQPGQEASDYFNYAGEYNYHCSIHTSMKGKIIVK